MDGLVLDGDLSCLDVDLEGREFHKETFTLKITSDMGIDTEAEFREGIGFCDIVICAYLESLDLILDLISCRKEDNGCGRINLDPLGKFICASVREHYIENDTVEIMKLDLLHSCCY